MPSFTELGSEAVVAAAIGAGEYFMLIPKGHLIAPLEFYDPGWRVIYSCALAVRSRGRAVCVSRINDEVSRFGWESFVQKLVDPYGALDWAKWHEKAIHDAGMADPTSYTIEYSLSLIHDAYVKRRSLEIRADPNLEDLELARMLKELHQDNGSASKGSYLFDHLDAPPDPADTLLGNRFLCRKGGMLFVGPSGIGKSSASIQQDLLWSMGRPAFGIKPAKPLRILGVQAEDDEGDIHEMVSGVSRALEIPWDQIEEFRSNVLYLRCNSLTGEEFLAKFVAPRMEDFKPDLLRINPLQAFLGGDIVDPKVTAAFLRTGLNSLLEQFNCGNITVHHTPKTNYRDTGDWNTSDWMYAGAGSADITNWARAILIIDPTEQCNVFRFLAAKRGRRIGWANEDGITIPHRFFAHKAQGGIHWEDCDEPQNGAGKKGQYTQDYTAQDVLERMDLLEARKTSVIQKDVSEVTGMSRNTFYRIWDQLRKEGKVIESEEGWRKII